MLDGEMTRSELQDILGLRDVKNFQENYLEYAQIEGFVKMKFAKNPHHPHQKYSLTEKGELFRQELLKPNSEGISEGVLSELEHLCQLIANDEGKKAGELNKLINKSLSTIERYLKILKDNGFIEFKGASKTGGYFIPKIRRILGKIQIGDHWMLVNPDERRIV